MNRISTTAGRVLLATIILGACADSPAGPDPVRLPERLHLVAEARSTEPDGRSVECSLDLHYRLTSEARDVGDFVEYQAEMGGEAQRTALNPDGSGVAFFADVGALPGEVVVRVVARDSVELHIEKSKTVKEPFWREFGLFAGRLDGEGRGSGRWTCSPLTVRGDTVLTAVGRWELAPEP